MTPPRSTSLGVLVVLFVLGWLAVRVHGESMAVTLPHDANYEADLIRHEGYRLTAYPDRQGTWSVGIGHSFGHARPRRMTYTPAEVETLFRVDLARALDAARATIDRFDELPPDVRLVVVGLVWTTGPNGFHQWRGLILALNYRAYNAATVELTRSRWWAQVSPERANAYLRILRSQP